MRRSLSIAVAAALLAAFALPLAAQEAKPGTPPVLRKEFIRLKYITAGEIVPAVRVYLDPRLGETISGDDKIVTVQATTETMERVVKAVRELDVKPADLLITVQLLLGEEADGKTDPELQADPIVKELRKFLRYKAYTLLDTSLVRAVDKGRSEVILGNKAEFRFNVRPQVVKEEKTDVIRMDVALDQAGVEDVFAPGPGSDAKPIRNTVMRSLIRSNLNIRPGDKTVVGVSKLDGGDKGLILIISGKVL